MERLRTLREQLRRPLWELQGGSRRRLLTRSRMSKRNFERKLTSYSSHRKEGLCVNTHTPPKKGKGCRWGSPSLGLCPGSTEKPMDLNSPKSCNIECRSSASTTAGDCPTSFAISRLVIPEKNASSIIRCCSGGIAFSTAWTSRRCSVILIQEVDLVLPPLVRNFSRFVFRWLQRRSMARRCVISISQVSGLSFCWPNGAALRRISS